MLKIGPTDRVLEIGSGNRPRKRSNVLCDKFVADNTERSGGDNIVIDVRPFVVADGLALPFKDKSFDYVISSHILEHVDDPHGFVKELTRRRRSRLHRNALRARRKNLRLALSQVDRSLPK